jgi:transcription termination factor Rho
MVDRKRSRGGRYRPHGRHRSQQPTDSEIKADIQVYGAVDLVRSDLGFLRQIDRDLVPSKDDCFIPVGLIQKHRLQTGMLISGMAGTSKQNAGPKLNKILEINGIPIEQYQPPFPFDRQVSIDPFDRFVLTPARTPSSEISMRVIELMVPIGKGQRSLIVAPPKTGKTTLLQDLAASISDHHPEVFLIILLVDERPEEVTHFKRAVPRGFVVASSMDQSAAAHLNAARLTLEIARQLAESGKDVFLLLDSLTRLGRSSNKQEGTSGRNSKTLSGGIGSRALEFPRKFFGSARKLEDGGSLTIVATALIDTGSRMDEVIFQEFKGTGNMELVLDRGIADARIFPAVDLRQSGTRKEEKLLPPDWLIASQRLRRHLSTLPPRDALEVLLSRLIKAESVQVFCDSLAKVTSE